MAQDHGAPFFDYPVPAAKEARAQAADVLLPDVSESDWTVILEFAQARRFSPGQSILNADGPGGSLYLVLEGTVRVFAPRGRFGRSRRAGLLETGSVVGEVSFFDSASPARWASGRPPRPCWPRCRRAASGACSRLTRTWAVAS